MEYDGLLTTSSFIQEVVNISKYFNIPRLTKNVRFGENGVHRSTPSGTNIK